jgi:hypothetical protein
MALSQNLSEVAPVELLELDQPSGGTGEAEASPPTDRLWIAVRRMPKYLKLAVNLLRDDEVPPRPKGRWRPVESIPSPRWTSCPDSSPSWVSLTTSWSCWSRSGWRCEPVPRMWRRLSSSVSDWSSRISTMTSSPSKTR